MPQDLCHDWNPESGVTMEAWAQGPAEMGWGVWVGAGGWTAQDGRRVWRVSLPREPEFLKAELRQKRRRTTPDRRALPGCPSGEGGAVTSLASLHRSATAPRLMMPPLLRTGKRVTRSAKRAAVAATHLGASR